MWDRLCDILNAAQGKRVLIVGDFMLDRYLYGDAERISPEAPVPVLRIIRENSALGGAGSVASDVAALGATCNCVGVLGGDADAQQVRNMLAARGADASGLIPDPTRPTTRKTRLIGLAQHRHRQQLIRIDEEVVLPVSDAITRELIKQVDAVVGQCDAICLEDYGKGVMTPALVSAVINAASRRGTPVLVDPAPTNDYRLYHGATAITPNRSETERVLGRRLPDISAVREHAAAIYAACGTKHVFVTLDADGMALIGPGGSFEHVPTRPRDVYDVTGAGDEVLAALAVSLAAGASLAEAATIANVAGGLEVGKFGCVPIERDELMAELLAESHKHLGKIRTLAELLPEIKRRRDLGHKVAFTNGCFDLMHAGHAQTFSFARSHADLLVVGLNSDRSVSGQGKGSGRPFVGQADRAALLAALADVDYIVLFDDDTPAALIEAIEPDVLVKGADWANKTVVGQDVVERRGGRVLLAPIREGLSTSILAQRIRGSVD